MDKLKQTIEAIPFKISLRLFVIVCLFLISVTATTVTIHVYQVGRITTLEDSTSRLTCALTDLTKEVRKNAEDNNITKVQFARIETKLAEISASLADLKKMR